MAERSLKVDHTTIWRWTQTYGPDVYRRLKGEVKRKSSTWHVDETWRRSPADPCHHHRAYGSVHGGSSRLRDANFARVKELGDESRLPIWEVLRNYPANAILAIGVVLVIYNYVITTFTPAYLTRQLGVPRSVPLTGLMLWEFGAISPKAVLDAACRSSGCSMTDPLSGEKLVSAPKVNFGRSSFPGICGFSVPMNSRIQRAL
jgi:hypothetical protein